MALRYVFVDEAGNFDFSLKDTMYFLLTSVTMDSCDVGQELAQLRRDLVRGGTDLYQGFHASEDRQVVRDAVFDLLSRHEFRIASTIFEKAKTVPRLRANAIDFYKNAWFFHLNHVVPQVASVADELFIVGANLNLNRRSQTAHEVILEVVGTAAGRIPCKTASWPAASDPCLQVADYCCWAIQRKWERNDPRSYVQIQHKIASEFEIFRWGGKRYR